MIDERWRETKRILADALEQPLERRRRYVAEACGANADLRREVESLLFGVPDDFLAAPLAGARELVEAASDLSALGEPDDLAPGTVLGAYTIQRLLGHGGMGTVLLAERSDGSFRQHVAVKVVHTGFRSGELLRRFRAERQILATLNHPNIARLIDGGTSPDGRPYLVMEYVDGTRIDRHCGERKLSITERLALFLQVCDAVEFAHRHLVIHRDLKPSNILVTRDGVPKLLDFGIAKLMGRELTEATLVETVHGHRAMTPEYAAPEQVKGEPVSTATDVYALGALLYELLTGTRACPLTQRTPHEVLRAVCEVEPRRPSTVADARLRRQLAGDLDNIVLMALRKEPERRYPSVARMADDLQRYQRRLPVSAHRDSLGYRARKFLRRNAIAATAVLVVFAVLIAGVVVTRQQRDRAEQQRLRAEAGEQRNRQLLYAAQMSLAYQAWDAGTVGRALELLDAQQPVGRQPDLRGFEWHLLSRLTAERSRVFRDPAGSLTFVSSPHDARLVAAAGTGGVYVWDTAAARLMWHDASHRSTAVAFAPQGVVLAEGVLTGAVHLRDRHSGRILATLSGHQDDITSIAFSPDGRMLATASEDRRVTLWQHDGTAGAVLDGHTLGVADVAFSPDGRTIATTSKDQTIILWDAHSGERRRVLRGHSWWVLAAAFAPNGATLATAGSDGDVKIWNARSGALLHTISGDGKTVDDVEFSPDGARLALAAQLDVRLFDATTFRLVDRLRGHTDVVRSVSFVSDARLASASLDGTARIWDLTRQPGSVTLDAHDDWAWNLAFSADGRTLATAGKDAAVKLWDADTGQPQLTLRHGAWVNAAAFSPDGRLIVTGGDEEILRAWDSRTGATQLSVKADGSINTVAVSPDGRLIAAGTHKGSVMMWEVQSGRHVATLQRPGRHYVWALAFSADGSRLAAAEFKADARAAPDDNAVVIWDVARRQRLATLVGHTADVRAVAFAPDSRLVASGGYDGTVRFWDTHTARQVAAITAHRVVSLAFSPDGTRLLTGGLDNMVKLWDVPTRQELCALPVPNEITAVAFSPDGRAIAASSKDHKVRMWFGS